MKTTLAIVSLVIISAIGYYFFMSPASLPGPIPPAANGPEGKIDINVVCEGALAYMSFPNGAEADAWVEACKRGEHPEAIDQWKQMNGFPTDSSAFRAEENMIVVVEQRPGTTITASQVQLAAPGFVVIHEDINGAPGAIIGASSLVAAGASSEILITLTRATRNGEKLHAMLHTDTDANGTFNAAIDTPVESRLGGPIEGWFEISADASTNPAITI